MALRGFGIGRNIRPEDIPAILAMSQQPTTHANSGLPHGVKEPAPAGSLADPPQSLVGPHGGSAYLLGKGMSPRGPGGGSTNFDRYAVNRGGKMLEAHDYGDGQIKYFARKNPADLQAAVQQKLGGLAPQDLELIKRLLGGGTLTR
jgi:hypothetical protein